MAITEINEMFVRSKDLSKVHRVEVEVHFTEPVTYSEAEEAVTYAISGYLFSRGHVDESNNEEEDTP